MPDNVPPLRLQADLLRKFWDTHGERRSISAEDHTDVIGDLMRLGEVVLVYSAAKLTPQRKRKVFDLNKNRRHRYMTKGAPCLACGAPAQVRHHIIWIKHGGINSKRNICFLCHDCHGLIHPWLPKR